MELQETPLSGADYSPPCPPPNSPGNQSPLLLPGVLSSGLLTQEAQSDQAAAIHGSSVEFLVCPQRKPAPQGSQDLETHKD